MCIFWCLGIQPFRAELSQHPPWPMLSLQWAREVEGLWWESEGSWARDILPTGLLDPRRHGEHSHSRLQEDCLTHRRQTEQASKTLHWLRCRLSFCSSIQQSCASEDQDHQFTILPTHPLPPWSWPVLRKESHLIFKDTACKATLIWHGPYLLCFTTVFMIYW